MADTSTPFLGLVKPGVGDSAGIDAWGGKLNNNFDTIDAAIKSVTGWKYIATFVATGSTAVADFTVPAGAKVVRITGVAEVGGSGAVSLIMRVSIDNGVTYKSGATDYAYSYLSQSGTAVAGASQFGFTHVYLSNSSDTANIGIQPVFSIVGVGAANKVMRYVSLSTYYVSASGTGKIDFHGYANFFGPITNIRILATSGNILAGTVLTLEYLS